jgi:two-component system, NtrC family, response regulator
MNRSSVLIIDDEETLRTLLARIIELEGYTVFQAEDAKAGLKIAGRETIHVIISDVKLPDANGVELTAQLKSLFPNTEVIVLTAFGTIEDGVKAMKNGAFDYLTKGEHQDRIIPLLAKASEKAQLQQRIASLEQKLSGKFGFERVLGESKLIRHAVEVGKKVAATDATVLLTGETGTGKEVFAQAIHYSSARKNQPFVAVNCSALGKDILESELFGHKEGAFTGATRDSIGLFREAHQGTLFLDEIGEMSIELQAKLLRVLETGSFFRVGDSRETHANVRVIAATNRDLKEEIKEGRFREDLYYRLSVFQITLPALRDRTEDIHSLVEFFIDHFSAKVNKKVIGLHPDFLESIKRHPWKGNVRELKNIVERAVILADGETLSASLLPSDFNSSADVSAPDLQSVEKRHIQKILTQTGGNKTQAAKILKIGLTTLYQKIKDLDLE